jgi:short-subunit dehydrogenase
MSKAPRRQPRRCEATADALRSPIWISHRFRTQEVVDHLSEELGRVDVLVNNPGTGTATPDLELDHATVREVLGCSRR